MAVNKINENRTRKSPDSTSSLGKVGLFPVVRARKDPPAKPQRSDRETLVVKKKQIEPQPNLPATKLRKEASQQEPKKNRDLRVPPANKIRPKLSIKRRKSPSELPWFAKLSLYLIRLTIVGVGLGAIAGTILASLERTSSSIPLEKQPEIEIKSPKVEISGLTLNRELTSVKNQIRAIANKYPKMQPRIFFFDLDDGSYVDIEASTPTSAASTIKIPILVAFFQDVDAGKIALDEMLTMNKEAIASGSGSMQYRKPGTKFSALETATKTIVISDNTATNMLIRRLGGAEALNQRFLSWGMKNTVIHNLLPDLKGTNTTSSLDLAYLLAKIEGGELLSLRSRDRLLAIMKKTRTKTLLPKGLGKGATFAHKTGDIGTILADAGLIDLPNGKRYLGAIMVKRPHNNYSARTMIQEISRTAYKHFAR